MPKIIQLGVNELAIDLKNFRTVPQENEIDAVNAMIAIKAERFYAVMESIIDDGYLPTENIIVLSNGKSNIVKEGNRRIASLKILHGHLPFDEFDLPRSLVTKIQNVTEDWKNDNLKVPCTIFSSGESDILDKIVKLAHGKGEKASRDPWSSVAKARHNRDMSRAAEHGLDLLETYLDKGQNVNNLQKRRWSGDFKITILDEALRLIYSDMGFQSIKELVTAYPKIEKRNQLENLLFQIGVNNIDFKQVRDKSNPISERFDLKVKDEKPSSTESKSTSDSDNERKDNQSNDNKQESKGQSGNASNDDSKSTKSSSTNQDEAKDKEKSSNNRSDSKRAYATNDPKQVKVLLRKFHPQGANRQKVVTLRDEMLSLNIKSNPHAFCFLLRSMFEISAKAYCEEHSIDLLKPKKKKTDHDVHKKLIEILGDVKKHLTQNEKNLEMTKKLHGAMAELSKPTNILSVTSMNQLIHNPEFSVEHKSICTMFGNLFFMLEAMN